MGQPILIKRRDVRGDVLLIDTDRSVTGQDGTAFARDEGVTTIPGRLAEAIFAVDPEIDHVFILQNTVTVRRRGGWEEAVATAVESAVSSFFLHY